MGKAVLTSCSVQASRRTVGLLLMLRVDLGLGVRGIAMALTVTRRGDRLKMLRKSDKARGTEELTVKDALSILVAFTGGLFVPNCANIRIAYLIRDIHSG